MIVTETINCNKILFGKIKGRKHFGDLGLYSKIIGRIEFILYKWRTCLIRVASTCPCRSRYNLMVHYKGKGKDVPLQAWSGPEGSRKLRFPDFMTTAQKGGKVISLTHRPPLPQEILLVYISVRG